MSEWASVFKVNHATVSGLLSTLRLDPPDLPKDPRTLLHINVNFGVMEVAGGEYFHFGVKNCVISQLESHPQDVENLDDVSLMINIDGLPIFKSSAGQLWPILGMIDCMTDKEPFVIGLFYGLKKPNDLLEYLSHFVEEMKWQWQFTKATSVRLDSILKAVLFQTLACQTTLPAFMGRFRWESMTPKNHDGLLVAT